MMDRFVSVSALRLRAVSALVLAPVILGIVAFGGPVFAALAGVAAAIGTWEWASMTLPTSKGQTPQGLGRLLAAGAGLSVFIPGAVDGNPYAALFFLLAIGSALTAVDLFRKWKLFPLVTLGPVYIGFSCAVMVWLRAGDGRQGLYHILTLLLVVWASDIFAYVAGRTFGGPKLAPRISPNKTWAGFLGSSAGAAIVAALLALPAFTTWMDVDTVADLSVAGYALLGAVLGAVGQAGDLSISLLKRRVGVKDTGALIPGHGGILDRIDALLLVALVYGLIVAVAA